MIVLLAWLGPRIHAAEQEMEADDMADLDFAEDNVDQWEAVPLPPPTEAELMRDSDELYHMHQSEVKRMLEQEEKFVQALGRAPRRLGGEDAELEEYEAELLTMETAGQLKQAPLGGSPGETDWPTIFNTDDFDDDYDDVRGDAPQAPPIEQSI